MLTRWFSSLRRGLIEHAPGAGKSNDGRDASTQPHPRSREWGGFVSDFEGFMNEFLEEHPEVEEDQRRGWSIWWNRRFNINELEESAKDTVPVGAYYYYDYTPPAPARPGGHGPGDDVPGRPSGGAKSA